MGEDPLWGNGKDAESVSPLLRLLVNPFLRRVSIALIPSEESSNPVEVGRAVLLDRNRRVLDAKPASASDSMGT